MDLPPGESRQLEVEAPRGVPADKLWTRVEFGCGKCGRRHKGSVAVGGTLAVDCPCGAKLRLTLALGEANG
jgi:hypothetical protein